MAHPNPRKLAHQPTKSSLMSRVFSFGRRQSGSEPGFSPSSTNKKDVERVGKFKHALVTETGSQHRFNEDRGRFILNLFDEFPTFETEYLGTEKKDCTCITVFDGHGGSGASDHACKNLPGILADLIWRGNYFDLIGSAIHHTFKQQESNFFELAKASNNTSGACALCVVIKGNYIYCGSAGDSKALFFSAPPGSKKVSRVVSLNDRHNTDNDDEVKRIIAAGGKKAISAEGAVYGVLYPTRGFGDLDVKALAGGQPVVIATPDGVGLGENEPVVMEYEHVNYLVVASDGVWDFLDDSAVVDIVLQNQGKKSDEQIAHEIREASRANGSEDDITVILVQITF